MKVVQFPLTLPIATSQMTGKQRDFNMRNVAIRSF